MGALLGTAQQLFYKPPFPAADFSGKTIIITGSNTGLGKDAVEHFARLKSERIIIAVRSLAKGEAVKAELEAKCKPEGSIDVWELDYSKYASVKAFVAKAATLDRIDAAILNAGVATEKFELFEEDESQVTVNVVSTMLLALLLLPVLRKVASKHHIVPVISVTSSAAHNFAINFRERTAENIFQALNDEKKTVMPEHCPTSKLLQLYAIRELAEKTSNINPFVIINAIDPGLCYTDLTRHTVGTRLVLISVLRSLFAWTAEEGSRALLHGATTGPQSHGIYVSGCQVHNNTMAPAILTEDNQKIQKKVWSQLAVKLEKIQPGVTAGL